MTRLTLRFQQNGLNFEEFCLFVGDDVLSKIDEALSDEVFRREGDGYVVTFDLCKPVPDVIRYWMSEEKWEDEGDTSWMRSPRENKGFPWGRPARGETGGILFFLESPHRDEISKALDPFVPAAGTGQGDTGYMLHSHREAVIYLLTQKIGLTFTERTPVIVGNPFQHPASLRIKGFDKALRDEVWVRAMLRDSFWENLLIRLKQYRPKVIINACTGEKGEMGSPKALTRYLIDEHLCRQRLTRVARRYYHLSKGGLVSIEQDGEVEGAECCIVEIPHPSGWRLKLDNWFPSDSQYKEWLKRRCCTRSTGLTREQEVP